MSDYKLVMPSMGEGIIEATITNWSKSIGDKINEDDTIAEVATDKVDSDLPSPVEGILKEILIPVNGIAKVGEPIAILMVSEEASEEDRFSDQTDNSETVITEQEASSPKSTSETGKEKEVSLSSRFYSPLIKSIAKKEGISLEELDKIRGSGLDERVTKEDVLSLVKARKEKNNPDDVQSSENLNANKLDGSITSTSANLHENSSSDEIIEMDRLRKIIAQNMVNSKQVSPHVTSFLEVDVTNIVLWRNKIKKTFLEKEGEKITFMPIFIEAIAKAISDYPLINVSVDGDKIIKKKNINIGMAAALPSGNLIVPVIKTADQYSLTGLTKQVNDLADRARKNKLKPEEIQGGTYTITHIGSFGNLMGTPIIPQPQVAIMAVGAIVKKPTVIETEEGDTIGIRHKMYLSHAYDHRVVDGALGGLFVKRVAEYLESFDKKRKI